MPIVTGSDSDFGRLVAEEFRRRAQRVVDLGYAAPDTDVDRTPDEDDDDAHSADGPTRDAAADAAAGTLRVVR